MYLDGEWYSLTAKEGTYNDNDPIGVLDVTILSDLVLDRLLGIKDLRTDKRIDFVGGIPGAGLNCSVAWTAEKCRLPLLSIPYP